MAAPLGIEPRFLALEASVLTAELWSYEHQGGDSADGFG
jgi:hypothetical protein